VKVFLSYAPNNTDLADKIADCLSGIVDIRRDNSSTGTIAGYSEQIAACDKIIVLVDNDANTSQRVVTQIIIAREKKKEILLFRLDDNSTIVILASSEYHKLPDDLDIEWFKACLRITSTSIFIDIPTRISQHKANLHDKHSKFPLVDRSRKTTVENGYVDCYIKEGLDDDTSAKMTSSVLIDNMPDGLVVIAGHPGTGKTTLLSYICYRMSDAECNFLPVFVPLKEFSIYCESFESFIFSGVNDNLSLNTLRQANDEYNFKCTILFDGLDEVASEVYEKIKVEINKIVAKNTWLTCILTTRIDGYKNVKQVDFRIAKPYTIAKLDEPLIMTYIDKWFKGNRAQADKIKKIIWGDVKHKELAQKAIFMLSLMCLLFEQDNTLESNMSLLYKKSVEFLVNTRRNLLEDQKKLRLDVLKIIALRFMQMQQKYFDKNLTEAIIGSFLKERLDGEKENAVDFISELITETGLLQKCDGNYSFTHLTFQEYFIAQAAIDSVIFNLESLLEYCSMPAWQEVFRLYFGLRSSLEDRNAFLKKLSIRNLSLSLRIISDSNMTQTKSALKDILSSVSANEKSRVVRGIKSSLSSLNFDIAQKLVVDTVKPLLALETNSEVLFFAIELLKEYDPDDKFQLMHEYFYKYQDEKFGVLLSNTEYLFDFIDIPAGSFEMGDDNSRFTNESPMHLVNLSRFRIAKHQLTNKAYEAIMGIAPNRTLISSDDKQPVINIDWYDAYICALKVGCRLPTEAEWEYAARAGTQTKWCFSDDENEAILKIHCKETKADKTRPVDNGEPNAWGLLNVHGNVWEWCSDWYGTYSAEEKTNPIGPSYSDLNTRVRRGGGWIYHAEGCRSCFRYGSEPSYRHIDIGVRLAKDC